MRIIHIVYYIIYKMQQYKIYYIYYYNTIEYALGIHATRCISH